MIRAGVTSFADMYYFEDSVAAATADAGLRALLGQTILTFPSPDAESYEDGIVLCRHFIEAWLGHPLITPAVAPHAWYTGTPDMLRACADLARAYDVPLHTHVSETAIEVENCREQTNGPVVPWINKHGLLDTKLLAAHCVHIDRGEMIKLRKAGAGIAHCPSSNLKLASGFAPIGKMLELDLNVGVGTDGPASNNDLDMFEEMRLAALLAKAVGQRSRPRCRRGRPWKLATIRGARAIHLDHLTGSLEPGKRADLIVVDRTAIHNWPHFHNNPEAVYSRLIYAAKSTDVDDVHLQRSLADARPGAADHRRTGRAAAAREVVAQASTPLSSERESSPYNKLVALAGVQRMESYEVQIKVRAGAGRTTSLPGSRRGISR